MDTQIDRYQILKSLNKGGMGEVFLAYDPLCKREVALKQILPHLKHHPVIKERFLREAQVASLLTHPSIIPIFSIDSREDKEFYTMPYVEGETLKQVLQRCLTQEKQGEITDPIGSSIPTLTRLFLTLCEAIAYTHSKGIIHRDLKPDNIILGTYGQVLLLDWGLADWIGNAERPLEGLIESNYKNLTRPGKVPGTLNYIAPERIHQEPSHVSIDIYSLGVIFYQLLTLRLPFQRSSIKEFKKKMHREELIDPIERAPYREIPPALSAIVKHCLHLAPQERFSSVDEMIVEIKRFLEGKPDWIVSQNLDPARSSDWEFQENILLSRHTEITRSPDLLEWVSLMISQACFQGHTRVETRIKLGRETKGIGLLIGVPTKEERLNLQEGFCLWISPHSRLLYNQVELMSLPGACIQDDNWHEVCLEKIDHQLFIHLDGQKAGHYISRIPISGTHIGLLCYDEDFTITPLKISTTSQDVWVNCLAIPDAFLSYKHYHKARLEYQKIARSFSGRKEGQEALFRSAITLVEEAKTRSSFEERESLRLLALEEFGKLRYTPAAPLEYLGKSLVYQGSEDWEEEIKCLELALRKYRKHPLIHVIEEQVLLRLYETTSTQRVAGYHFALLALRHLPQILTSKEHNPLLTSLNVYLERLPFFLPAEPLTEDLACQLCLWLNKPIVLVEMIETSSSASIIANCFYALLLLSKMDWAQENLHYLTDPQERELLISTLLYFKQGPQEALTALLVQQTQVPANAFMRSVYFVLDRADLDHRQTGLIPYFDRFAQTPFMDALQILFCLREGLLDRAKQRLETYPPEILHNEYSPLFIPMGCYLLCTEDLEIAKSHFATSIDLPHPPTSMLLGHYLLGTIDEHSPWMLSKALFFEKVYFWRQLDLYFHCIHQSERSRHCSQALHSLLHS